MQPSFSTHTRTYSHVCTPTCNMHTHEYVHADMCTSTITLTIHFCTCTVRLIHTHVYAVSQCWFLQQADGFVHWVLILVQLFEKQQFLTSSSEVGEMLRFNLLRGLIQYYSKKECLEKGGLETLVCFCFRTGHHIMQCRLAFHSVAENRLGTSDLCLPSAGVTVVCKHAQFSMLFWELNPPCPQDSCFRCSVLTSGLILAIHRTRWTVLLFFFGPLGIMSRALYTLGECTVALSYSPSQGSFFLRRKIASAMWQSPSYDSWFPPCTRARTQGLMHTRQVLHCGATPSFRALFEISNLVEIIRAE